MKVTVNKIFKNPLERMVIVRNGKISGFKNCITCGKSLDTTYYVCMDCANKLFTAGGYDLHRFIDYVNHYTKIITRGGVHFGVLPIWSRSPADWTAERRRGTI
jgi:hypothetical protein